MQLVGSSFARVLRAIGRVWSQTWANAAPWRRAVLLLAVSGLCAIAFVLGVATRSAAVDFVPPDRNAPGRVIIGGGARFSPDALPGRDAPDSASAGGARFADFDIGVDGVRLLSMPGRECPLTAALPASNSGLTLRPYPSVFIHMPPYPGEMVEFKLTTEGGALVYATQFVPQPIDGTYDITLPESSNLPPLEVGVMYRWTFAIPSEDLTLSGGIIRGEATEAFAAQLAAASAKDRVRLLAETGIWYDAVTDAAALVRSDRDRADYKALWDDLMYSVGMNKMAVKPLL
ncbi:MAG: DUF928 domain-containing protein [Geitlerinemataceae cyanobacterium]